MRRRPTKKQLDMIRYLRGSKGREFSDRRDQDVLRSLIFDFDPPLAEYSSDSSYGWRGWRLTSEGRSTRQNPDRRPGIIWGPRPYYYRVEGNPESRDWQTYAGGTGAVRGKRSYGAYGDFGQYHIEPPTVLRPRGGYSLKFADTEGKLTRQIGGGLWRDLGSYRSPQAAKKAARVHRRKYGLNPELLVINPYRNPGGRKMKIRIRGRRRRRNARRHARSLGSNPALYKKVKGRMVSYGEKFRQELAKIMKRRRGKFKQFKFAVPLARKRALKWLRKGTVYHQGLRLRVMGTRGYRKSRRRGGKRRKSLSMGEHFKKFSRRGRAANRRRRGRSRRRN